MDFLQVVKERRSIRKYRKQGIPGEVLESLFEIVRQAPSAKNLQPWKFIVIKNKETRQKLAEATEQPFVGEAPVLICACGLSTSGKIGKKISSVWVDVGIAISYFILAASNEGLGTCIIGHFEEKKVKEILSIPEEVKVIGLITLGYPEAPYTPGERKKLPEILSFEKYE